MVEKTGQGVLVEVSPVQTLKIMNVFSVFVCFCNQLEQKSFLKTNLYCCQHVCLLHLLAPIPFVHLITRMKK